MAIEVRNHTKIRVLLYLKEVADQAVTYGLGGAFAWRAPATIANHTEVNVASLYTILKRWRSNKWGYADAIHFEVSQMRDGRPHWLYKINAKGQSYLARLHKWYKAETEVRASLNAYWAEICCDFVPWHGLAPAYIVWHVKPSQLAISITWPFESEADARSVMTYTGGYKVADIQEAVNMARSVFHVMPSKECMTRAKALQDYYVKKALAELAKGAGFAPTDK